MQFFGESTWFIFILMFNKIKYSNEEIEKKVNLIFHDLTGTTLLDKMVCYSVSSNDFFE